MVHYEKFWKTNLIVHLTVCPLTSCAVSIVHIKLSVSSNVGFCLIFLSNIAIHKSATLLQRNVQSIHHQNKRVN